MFYGENILDVKQGGSNMIFADDRVNNLINGEEIPKMATVKQLFDSYEIDDVAEETRNILNHSELKDKVKEGMTIAITAGSRGINDMDIMIRETVTFLKSLGAEPFIIPAMGSHGGAVAEGQVKILESYNITEEKMGAPIRATMEVVKISELEDGTPVYIDKYANEADGIVIVNRIKPHTAFRAKYESGILKMIVIGLGKQYGAEVAHNCGVKLMGETIEKFGKSILKNSNIIFGLATIENAFDKTYKIVGMTPDEILTEEPKYLIEASSKMPSILFEDLDVLVVDQIGKNISGSGMDPNITHTFLHESGIDRSKRAKRIAILDVNSESYGSTVGVGYGDTTTRRLFDKMDCNTTYPNCLTTGGSESPRIPMVFQNDKLAIQATIKIAVGADKKNLRMVRIKDTLHLGEIEISEALLEEAKKNAEIEIIQELKPLKFDENGNLF